MSRLSILYLAMKIAKVGITLCNLESVELIL